MAVQPKPCGVGRVALNAPLVLALAFAICVFPSATATVVPPRAVQVVPLRYWTVPRSVAFCPYLSFDGDTLMPEILVCAWVGEIEISAVAAVYEPVPAMLKL